MDKLYRCEWRGFMPIWLENDKEILECCNSGKCPYLSRCIFYKKIVTRLEGK